jgi:ribonuclease HI
MVEIYVDGGSRGNPGYAGGGFVIFEDGRKTAEGSEYFGKKTNNQAEYLALRSAMRKAYEKLGAHAEIQVYMDSMLAVEQMNGNWKVKSENVRPLFQEVRRIADQFKSFSISHIPREKNTLADKLANDAMDRGY